MILEVLKTVLLHIQVSLDVSLHCWASGSVCVEGSYCVHLERQAGQEGLSGRKKVCL